MEGYLNMNNQEKQVNQSNGLRLKPENLNNRLRNRIIRKLGGVPMDDFELFISDVMKVLEAYERFSKDMGIFYDAVSKKLGIRVVEGTMVMEEINTGFKGKEKSDRNIDVT
jgi:hypothetical protein